MHMFGSNPSPLRSPKPNCSYHCMIAMALQASPGGKLPVNEIYKYILNRFPYFRTAADNWKNSVRHCLSLGHCFHKVVKPGTFAHKKGFHWEVVPGKIDDLNQEIYKYISTIGQTPESFGIHESKLTSPNQGVPLTLSSQRPSEAIPLSISSPLTHGSVHPADRHQPTNSPASNISAMLGSVGVIGLQLNQSDIEILNKLPHLPSTYELNLLSSPDVHRELSTIMDFIQEGGSLASLSDQQHSLQTIDQTISIDKRFNDSMTGNNEHVPHYHVTKVNSTQYENVVSVPYQQTTVSKSSLSHTEANSVGASSKEVKVHEIGDQANCYQSRTKIDTTNIDYSSHSPIGFTVQYPDHTGRVEEEVYDHDPSYPFICSDEEENNRLKLHQWMKVCESDVEDEEDPLPKTRTSKRRPYPQHFDIEPVNEDWNCWNEREYEEKMKQLINSINTTLPAAPPSILISDSESSQSSSNTSEGDPHQKHRRGKVRVHQTRHPTKRALGHSRRWWAKRKEKHRSQKKHKNIRSHDNSNEPTSETDIRRHNTATQESLFVADPSSMVVSVPFIKLLTSRQMKKYCSQP